MPQNSKLFRHLSVLTRVEWKRFKLFVVSPYFTRHKDTISLFKALIPYYPEFKVEDAFLFKKAFPEKDYNYENLRLLKTYVLRLVLDFLFLEEAQQKYIAETEVLINKFRAKKNKAAFAQSLIKKLDKLERIEVDGLSETSMAFSFPPAPRTGKVVVKTEGLQKSYDEKEIFDGVDMQVGRQDKVALVGKNGTGKTTLTKIILKQTGYSGDVEIGHNVDVGYYAQNQTDTLDPNLTVFETIDEVAVGDIRTQVRGLLGAFLFRGEDIDKKVKVLSGGEKARLALCKLMLHPYNLLILDEPTNHLDLQSKDVLKNALMKYDGTLIIVSHDRDFLHGLTDYIYEVGKKRLREYRGDILEFLQEKRAKSIAEFEAEGAKRKKEKVQKEQAKSADGELGYKERKQLEKDRRKMSNRIGNLEKEINQLEEKLAKLTDTLNGADYSDKAKVEPLLNEFNGHKVRLDECMKEWEETEFNLAEFDEKYPALKV